MKMNRISRVLMMLVAILFQILKANGIAAQETLPPLDDSSPNAMAAAQQEEYNIALSKGYLLIKSNIFEDGV